MKNLKLTLFGCIILVGTSLTGQPNCEYLRNILSLDGDDYYALMSVKDYPQQEVFFTLSVLKQFYEIEFGVNYEDTIRMDSIILKNCDSVLDINNRKLQKYLKDYLKVDSKSIERLEKEPVLEIIITRTSDKFQLYNLHKDDLDSMSYYSNALDMIIETAYLEIPQWFDERELLIAYFIKKGIVLRQTHNQFLEVVDKNLFLKILEKE